MTQVPADYLSTTSSYNYEQPLPSVARTSTITQVPPAKKITFFKSGDPQFGGVKMAINQRSFKSFNALMDDLSHRVPLPFGVRTITTPRGIHCISELDQLEDGGCYLCSDKKYVKPISITSAGQRPGPPRNGRPSSTLRRAAQEGRLEDYSTPFTQHGPRIPKKITLLKNGEIGFRRSIILQFPVKKLYTVDGKKIDSMQALLHCPSVLVCVGREPFKPVPVENLRKHSAEKLPGLASRSNGNNINENNEMVHVCTERVLLWHTLPQPCFLARERTPVNFGLKAKKSVIHPRSASSNRSMRFSLSSEKSYPNGLTTSPDNGAPFTNNYAHAKPGDLVHSLVNDDIEKRVHVNKDGSLSVEMKVRFRLLNDETLQWSTQIKKSNLMSQMPCEESGVEEDSGVDPINKMNPEASSEADDSLYPCDVDSYMSKLEESECEEAQCHSCGKKHQDYDIWKNPMHSSQREEPSVRSTWHKRSSCSSTSSRRRVVHKKMASVDSLHTTSSEEFSEHIVRESSSYSETIENRVAYRSIKKCTCRSDLSTGASNGDQQECTRTSTSNSQRPSSLGLASHSSCENNLDPQEVPEDQEDSKTNSQNGDENCFDVSSVKHMKEDAEEDESSRVGSILSRSSLQSRQSKKNICEETSSTGRSMSSSSLQKANEEDNTVCSTPANSRHSRSSNCSMPRAKSEQDDHSEDNVVVSSFSSESCPKKESQEAEVEQEKNEINEVSSVSPKTKPSQSVRDESSEGERYSAQGTLRSIASDGHSRRSDSDEIILCNASCSSRGSKKSKHSHTHLDAQSEMSVSSLESTQNKKNSLHADELRSCSRVSNYSKSSCEVKKKTMRELMSHNSGSFHSNISSANESEAIAVITEKKSSKSTTNGYSESSKGSKKRSQREENSKPSSLCSSVSSPNGKGGECHSKLNSETPSSRPGSTKKVKEALEGMGTQEEESDLIPSTLPNTSPEEVVQEWLSKIPSETLLMKYEMEEAREEACIEATTEEQTSEVVSEPAKASQAECSQSVASSQNNIRRDLPTSIQTSVQIMKALLGSKHETKFDRSHSLPEVSPTMGRKLSDSAISLITCLASLQLLDEESEDPSDKSKRLNKPRYMELLNIFQALWFGCTAEKSGPSSGQEASDQAKASSGFKVPKSIDDDFTPMSSSGVDVSSGSSGSGEESTAGARDCTLLAQKTFESKLAGQEETAETGTELTEAEEQDKEEEQSSRPSTACSKLKGEEKAQSTREDSLIQEAEDNKEDQCNNCENGQEEEGENENEENNKLAENGEQGAEAVNDDLPKENLQNAADQLATTNDANISDANSDTKLKADLEKQLVEESPNDPESHVEADTAVDTSLVQQNPMDPDPIWVLKLLKKIEKEFMTHYVSAMNEFKVRWNLQDNQQLDEMILELKEEVSKRIQKSIERELRKIKSRAGRKTPRPPCQPLKRESTLHIEQRRRRLQTMHEKSFFSDKNGTQSRLAGTSELSFDVDEELAFNAAFEASVSEQPSEEEYCPCDSCVRKKMVSKPTRNPVVATNAPVMKAFDLHQILKMKKDDDEEICESEAAQDNKAVSSNPLEEAAENGNANRENDEGELQPSEVEEEGNEEKESELNEVGESGLNEDAEEPEISGSQNCEMEDEVKDKETREEEVEEVEEEEEKEEAKEEEEIKEEEEEAHREEEEQEEETQHEEQEAEEESKAEDEAEREAEEPESGVNVAAEQEEASEYGGHADGSAADDSVEGDASEGNEEAEQETRDDVEVLEEANPESESETCSLKEENNNEGGDKCEENDEEPTSNDHDQANEKYKDEGNSKASLGASKVRRNKNIKRSETLNKAAAFSCYSSIGNFSQQSQKGSDDEEEECKDNNNPTSDLPNGETQSDESSKPSKMYPDSEEEEEDKASSCTDPMGEEDQVDAESEDPKEDDHTDEVQASKKKEDSDEIDQDDLDF
nr:PREDICTED: LOW QUALITY PROTEIN: retinitis pigmentosa 1-like 1 protein [Struthio camelus australis]